MRLVDYAQDAALEGMWHAAFVRSPVPHGRVRSIDASALPADAVALLPADTAGLGRYGCQLKDQQVLADPARFVGDIVAAVAAPTPAAARAAALSLAVEYEELPAVFDALAAVAEGAPLLHPEPPARPRTPSRSACARWPARTSATASGSSTETPSRASRRPP